MPLESKHFSGNERLQRCLVENTQHVVPGSRGKHVGLIQKALMLLGAGVVSEAEIRAETYGPTTATSVLKYKQDRSIINFSYQKKADNIVGIMTIERLDQDMVWFEKKYTRSLLVCTDIHGDEHDHSKCPRLEGGDHEMTPINPNTFGRRINLYGAGETDYLDFEDYAIDPEYRHSTKGAGLRPLTWDRRSPGYIRDNTVSDIAIRSVPILSTWMLKAHAASIGKELTFPSIAREIRRIAMPGCRITFAGEPKFAPRIMKLGTLVERAENSRKGSLQYAWVVVFLGDRTHYYEE